MSDNDFRLLANIAAETERIKGLSPYRGLKDDPDEWVQRSQSLRLVDEFGVRVQSDWLGTTGAQRKALFRSLGRIEQDGLVEVFTTGRIKFTKLTEAGLHYLAQRTETP